MPEPSNKPRLVPKADPPRSPERSDERRIFRTIDEHYRDDGSGYIGDASDDALAKQLGVPRKWVTDVRISHFGESDSNDAMVDLLRQARDAIAQAEKLRDDFLEKSAVMDATARHIIKLADAMKDKLK